jgi:disulfide bond formation protein DsbB
MIQKLFKAAFVCPHFILMMLGGLSIAALAAALTSQYVFGMHPCELCLYQRIPYAVVILLAGLGIIATKAMGAKYGAFNIALCGIAFLINSGIAFFHVGVEQAWWSYGCSVPDMTGLTPDEMMAAIKSASTVSCSDIPWQMFGISMAGYNVILCLGLGFYASVASSTVIKNKSAH